MHKRYETLGGKARHTRVWMTLAGATALIMALQGFINPQLIANAATAPPLGTAINFALLAGSAVTNTGPTVITGGSLGVSPGNTVTGFLPGIVTAPGTIHAGDAPALQAQNDVTTAYNNLAGQPCNTNLTGQDLGGLTLTAGVYCFPATSGQLTGNLILNAAGDANAVFIIQIGTSLTTASNAVVQLIGGANPCNIFWQVGSSATLGTATSFVGNMLVLTSISLTTGASISGRALARNGAVTLDSNNISAPICVSAAPTPTPTFTPVPTSTPTMAPNSTPMPTPTFPAFPTSTSAPNATAVVVLTPTTLPNASPTVVNATPAPTLSGTPTPVATTPPTTPAAGTPTPTTPAAGTPTSTTPAAGTPTPTPTPRSGQPPLPDTGTTNRPAETFPETGFSLSEPLLSFWYNNGGLPIFGFPIDSERQTNGRVSQWFERNRLELHPENTEPYTILLGRLGAEVLEKKGIDWTTLPKISAAPEGCRYFVETSHSLCGDFLAYWQSHGLKFAGSNSKTFAESLALFGLPLSEPRMETNSSGDTILTQWFERARFEYHPDKPSQYRVLLGLLGAELKMYLYIPFRSKRL